MTDRPQLAGYQPVGPKDYLDRLLREYELAAADMAAETYAFSGAASQ